MVIAVDLHFGLEAEPCTPKASDVRLWGFDRRVEMMQALERSIRFWRVAKSDSIEAAKAWGLFSYSLNNTKRALSNSNSLADPWNAPEHRNIPATPPLNQDSLGAPFDNADADLEIDWVSYDQYQTLEFC